MGPWAHRDALSAAWKSQIGLAAGENKQKKKKNSFNMWNFPEAELFISEPEFTANNLINRDVWWSCAVCECWRKRVDSWQNSGGKRSVEMLMVCAHLACAHDIWAEFLSRLLSAPLRLSGLDNFLGRMHLNSPAWIWWLTASMCLIHRQPLLAQQKSLPSPGM